MSNFFDAKYATLKPYTPGEQQRGKKIVKLNTNESPYPPSLAVRQAVAKEAKNLNLYPDISGGMLFTELAKAFNVKRENVFAGNGSDEILAFIFQAFCPNGAAFADLTYGFYSVYANLYRVKTELIPLRDDFSLCAEDYIKKGKTIFIANPNAPTGLAITKDDVEKILLANRENLVVIDEAYVDFGAESSTSLLKKHKNLLVVGTFSKSRSLAGARLGYALGAKDIIEEMERVKYSFNPYNINQMTMAAGAAALQDKEYYKNCQNKIIETRDKTIESLKKLGFNCTKSQANFIFCSHKQCKAKYIYKSLKALGILVRWFDVSGIENYLRISVGSTKEMKSLLCALKQIVQEGKP